MIFLNSEDHAMNMPLTKPMPLLKDGDRLTRDEFERRYEAMPESIKAELIDGVVYMASPVNLDDHGEPHIIFDGWLAFYRVFTPGVRAGDNSSVRLDMKSEPQPDGLMFIEHSGQARVVDGYVTGAPDLASEVSASSVEYDLGTKLEAYRRNGVREYVVWRVLDEDLDWFVLRDEQYERLTLDTAGILRSEVFPGLWLDKAALLNGDLRRVFEVLQQGINSPEHADFVVKLQQMKK
jgi:Uma2 family endonuclease